MHSVTMHKCAVHSVILHQCKVLQERTVSHYNTELCQLQHLQFDILPFRIKLLPIPCMKRLGDCSPDNCDRNIKMQNNWQIADPDQIKLFSDEMCKTPPLLELPYVM